jgi:RNA polymerase sigma-70 factor (ECF subfamily)
MSQVLLDSSVLSAVAAASDGHDEERRTRAPSLDARQAGRIRAIVAEHYGFLWRSLRRLGVPEADVEDAAQKCLCVVADRIDDVADGREKSFLFGVALRIAQAARRATQSRRDVLDEERIAEALSPDPDADRRLDEQRARAWLDAILEAMPAELRTVFILYEVEEMTMAEIASTLELAQGTVASRLRRARATFEAHSLRLRRRLGPERTR